MTNQKSLATGKPQFERLERTLIQPFTNCVRIHPITPQQVVILCELYATLSLLLKALITSICPSRNSEKFSHGWDTGPTDGRNWEGQPLAGRSLLRRRPCGCQ